MAMFVGRKGRKEEKGQQGHGHWGIRIGMGGQRERKRGGVGSGMEEKRERIHAKNKSIKKKYEVHAVYPPVLVSCPSKDCP